MPLMIGSLGPLELAVIAGLVLLIFGAKKLPQLGSGLGQGIRNFKSSVTGADEKELEPESATNNEQK